MMMARLKGLVPVHGHDGLGVALPLAQRPEDDACLEVRDADLVVPAGGDDPPQDVHVDHL